MATRMPMGVDARTTFEPEVIQLDYVEAIIRDLAAAVLGRNHGPPRALLHETLASIQPDAYNWSADGPDVQFDDGDGLEEPVLRRIMVVDELPGDWEIEPELRPAYRAEVARALSTLEEVDAPTARSVRTVIGTFVFGRLPGYGGGSNSSAIGCVWLNPKHTWTEADWLENVLHEYVHQCLFMDDMRHGLFAHDGELLAREDALVESAILRTRRPYDRAFHSAFVSFALMQLNLRLGMRHRVDQHIEPLRNTLDQLQGKSQELTAHGRSILDSLCFAFDDEPGLRTPC